LQNIGFGPDGNLYGVSQGTNQILRYQGPSAASPGAFMGVFVSINNHGTTAPKRLAFDPSGNLYVDGGGYDGGWVDRFDGPSATPYQGNGVFVAFGSGGLNSTGQMAFDPSGNYLYVVRGASVGEILRYQGPSGANPGAFVDTYIAHGQTDLNVPIGVALDPNGNLFVSQRTPAQVTRFAPAVQASFIVSLDSANTSQVSVNYTTIDGTALAGTDYTQTSGTLIFSPGVTSQTINVPITTVLTGGPTKTFLLKLSGAVNATINRAQGTAGILNRITKFYVVDGHDGRGLSYEYGSGGTSEEINLLNFVNTVGSGDSDPRGITTTATGDTFWTVNNYQTVWVYNAGGVALGVWTADGMSKVFSRPEGIATNGSDIWLVDNNADRVYKYANAASLRSGSQSASSNFKLASGNNNPKGIVTDGTYLWVVDDGSSSDKVFKYNLSGKLIGSWAIDPANSSPTGLTINPNNVSDIWIVDNGTKKVYQYTAAASRTSGSQNAAATFALAADSTNPQDIADPPPADEMLPLPTRLAAVPPTILAPAPTLQPAPLVPVATNRDAFFALLGNLPSTGSVNQITQRQTDRSVAPTLPPSPEAAPTLAARSDAVFAGSQQATDEVLTDVPLLPDEEVAVAVE
jgi:hypothetical protein